MSVTSSLCQCTSDSETSCARASRCSFQDMHGTNAFPFFGQPLIYYAGVPEVYGMQYKGQQKDKTNYFVKAFRWYTQEPGANKSTADGKNDIGFAIWLDQKYEQYLWDSQLKATQKSAVSSSAKDPTAPESMVTTNSAKSKGFQRVLKSPWRKRRASAKSAEAEGNCTECKPSWRIILRPKSLSRLPSENCTQGGPPVCYASSKITVASSDTQISTRTHSKKLGFVVQEISMRKNYAADPDGINICDKGTVRIITSNSQHTYTVTDYDCAKVKTSMVSAKCECAVEAINDIVKCECPAVPEEKAKVDKMDVSTQCDPNINNSTQDPSKSSVLVDKSAKPERPRATEGAYITAPNEEQIKIDSGDQNKLKPICAYKIGKKYRDCQRPDCCCHARGIHGAVQTSDHALTMIVDHSTYLKKKQAKLAPACLWIMFDATPLEVLYEYNR